ncbi:MAG: 1-acyl-sn-glycerol-3-phosphate acyltransferase [Pirellulales bacterium]|nr:1-acyl-sn-glycerol-3-phosphate acyltransferase [Pirellulales bacterium]
MESADMLGTGVLVAAGLALVGWAASYWRRSAYTPAQTFFFAFNFCVARLLWRAHVSRPLPVAPGQGAVIVCNHRSSVDPAFIAVSANRLVHWLVAREYCEHPFFGWFLQLCEVVPVGRGGVDTAATKLAIRYAQEGGLVGLFPEGRINTTDQLLLPGRPGAAMIALKARVPVIPCYVSGSPYDGTPLGCMTMPAKVRLQVGRPIDLSPYYGRENDRELIEDLTRRLLLEIARLAGHPDFRPQLAGRFYKPGLADD